MNDVHPNPRKWEWVKLMRYENRDGQAILRNTLVG